MTKPSSPKAGSPDRRVALLLEYDGSRYAGSQLQANALTVQGVLEHAIEKSTGERVRAAFAGRTDAGVHARGQVASFRSSSRLSAGVIQRALNAWLPQDVVVRAAVEADPALDVRRHALRRRYRYLIDNQPTRAALGRNRAWHLPRRLDIHAMADAAERLIGERDFRAFAGIPERPEASTVRRLDCLKVSRRGTHVRIDVVGNSFLPHQVRRIAGSLIEAGYGRLSPGDCAALLLGPPASAGPVAPACGLYLMAVEYALPLFAGLESSEGAC